MIKLQPWVDMEENEWVCEGDLHRNMVEDEDNLGDLFLGKWLKCLEKCRTRENPREYTLVKCSNLKGRERGFPKVTRQAA